MRSTKFFWFAFVPALLVPFVLTQAEQVQPKSSPSDKAKDLFQDLNRNLFNVKPTKDILESLAALQKINEELRSANRKLEFLLTNRDPEIRKQAARTIAEINRNSDSASDAVKLLAKLLDDRNVEVQAGAFFALARMVPQTKAVMPEVLKGVKNDDPRVRRAAYVVISRLLRFDKELIQHVIAAIDDPDLGPDEKNPGVSSVSDRAFDDLIYLQSEAKAAAPKLVKMMKSKKKFGDHEIRGLRALAKVSPEEPFTLEIARQWVKATDDPAQFLQGLMVICELGPHAKDAIPDLIAAAKAKPQKDTKIEISMKQGIARAFQLIGPLAKEALPILEEMSRSQDFLLRQTALDAIKSVSGNQ